MAHRPGTSGELNAASIAASTEPASTVETTANQLHGLARAGTPLPTSGLVPRDYPGPGLPVEVDRAAGRTYLARLEGADEQDRS